MYLNAQGCYDRLNGYGCRVWPDLKKAFFFAVLFGGLGIIPFETTQHISGKAISEGIMLIALTSFLLASMIFCGLGLIFHSRKNRLAKWFEAQVIGVHNYFNRSTFTGVSWLIGLVAGLSFVSLFGEGANFAAIATILITAVLLHVLLLSMNSLLLGQIRVESLETVRFLGMLMFLGGIVSFMIFPWDKYY